jgi:hypothetical protein
MKESVSPYNRLLQTVAEAQDTKGDGGCFMELFREIESIAGIVTQNDGILQRLGDVVKALPGVQTDEALKVAYKEIDAIREILSS